MTPDVDAGSTPAFGGSAAFARRDTLVDQEDSTAEVPGYAISLAQNLAQSLALTIPTPVQFPPLLLAPPRSGIHAVIPPPRRHHRTATDAACLEDDEPTSKHPGFIRMLADSMLDELEHADPLPGSDILSVNVSYDDDPEEPAADEQRWADEPSTPNMDADMSVDADMGVDVDAPAPGAARSRSLRFYWAVSMASVFGACALTAALLRGAPSARTPHVYVPERVSSCLLEVPARPVAASAVALPLVRRDVVDTGTKRAVHATAAVRHRASPGGIVRDLPF